MRLLATIAFRSKERGGHAKPILLGVRPQLKIGDQFTSVVVTPISGVEQFTREVPTKVYIDLMFGTYFAGKVPPGMSVQLNDGSRIIAEGIVDEVIAP